MTARIQQAFQAAKQQQDHEAGLALEAIINDAFSIEQLQIDLESEIDTYGVIVSALESLESNPALESTFEVPANHYIDAYSLEADGAMAKLKEVGSAVWAKIKEIFAKIKEFFKALFAKIMEFFQKIKFEALAWWKPGMAVDMEVSSETISYLRGALSGTSINLKPAIGMQAFNAHLEKLKALQDAARSLSASTTGFMTTTATLGRKTADIAKLWDSCTVQIGPWSINRSLAADHRLASIGDLERAMHQTSVSEVQDHAKSVKLSLKLESVKAMEKDLQESQFVTGLMQRLTTDLDNAEGDMKKMAAINDGQGAQVCLQSASLVAKVSRAMAGDIQKYAQVVQKGYDVYKVAVRNAKLNMKVAANEPIEGKFTPRTPVAAGAA